MKAKITANKMRFLMLCLTVLFSVMGISFSAAAAETCAHPNLVDSNWDIIQKTTCQGAGYKTQWCYDCGTEVREDLPFDENAHVKGEWVTVKPHSCQQNGYQVLYCYYGCLHKEGENAGEKIILGERSIPAHNYEIIFKEVPTCQKEGYQFVACLDCYDMKSVTLPIDEDNHDYTPWYVTKDATCSETGIEERKCLYCAAKETREIPVTDSHTNVVWDEANKLAATCDAPGYVPGICQDCNKAIKKEIPQHSESPYIVISKTESTCSTNGIERRSCECGLEYDAELPLNPENHVYESDWIISKQPSCTDGSRFKFCKYHYEAKIVQAIPSNGEHNYGDWVVEIEPDCSKTGVESKTCLDCDDSVAGHKITRELPTKHDFGTWTEIYKMSCDEKEPVKGVKLAKCDNCDVEKYFTIPSLHSYSEWKVVVKADCKNADIPGKMERICSVCKKVETKEYYAEHDFTDWFATDKPSCAVNGNSGRSGTYTRWCKSCKATEHKAIGVNHAEFVDVVIDRYPECFNNGATSDGSKTVKCKFCDYTKSVLIPASHNFGEWEITKANTCTETGEKARTCLSCGYIEKQIIDAGHDYGYWLYNGGKIKCSDAKLEPAVALKRYCKNCSAEDPEIKMVTKLDHPNKISVVTEVSCTSSGYTTEICPDCGYEAVVGEITPAKGHTLDAHWTAKKQATCTSAGSRYKACADCDYIEFQLVAKTEHTLIELKPGLAPTCTLPGYSSESICAVCKTTIPSVELAPLGHNIPEGSEICTVCKAYKDTNCGCACHSTSGMEKIFFNLINRLYQLFGINQKCSCGVLHYDEPGFIAKLFGKA